jgi:hypothetical protein
MKEPSEEFNLSDGVSVAFGGDFNLESITTNTLTDFYFSKRIVNFVMNENQKGFELTIRTPSGTIYANGESVPDYIVKEFWIVNEDGKIIKDKEITGRVIPAYNVPEQIKWDD